MLASVRERLQREYARKGLSPAQWRHVTRHLDPAQSRHADHRLRAAIRHVQARGAAAAGSRAARAARERSGAAGAVPVRRQGASRGSARASRCCARSSSSCSRRSSSAASCSSKTTTCSSRAGSCRACDVWLNNPIAPLEASGTSGMKAAQNGAPEPERARWLVGGRLDAGQRLGHSADQRAGPGAARCARSRAHLRHARRGDAAALLLAQRRWLFAGVGAPQQARDGDRDSALQHASHGVRLRAGHLLPAARVTPRGSPSRTSRARARSRTGNSACGRHGRRSGCADCGCARRTCRAASACGCAWPRR